MSLGESRVVGYNRFGQSQSERSRKAARTTLRRASRAVWEDAADPAHVLGVTQEEIRELPYTEEHRPRWQGGFRG